MIDGAGDPNTVPAYITAVQSLHGLAYGICALSKASGLVYSVMPLEGLWWFATGAPIDGDERCKDKFIWTMMIRQPDHITPALFNEALAASARKKPDLPFDAVRLETYHEGKSAQILHMAPYSEEEPTISRLHNFIAASGCTIRGQHHEIYLNDPRKVAPEKIKTIIRYPVE
ncbi:MAG: GyrI-like domain-containing protein [Chloroflexota bacterium]